jgi:hypothetical protein
LIVQADLTTLRGCHHEQDRRLSVALLDESEVAKLFGARAVTSLAACRCIPLPN